MNAIALHGAVLPEHRFGPFTQSHIALYAAASLDDNPLHTDPRVAEAAGLGAPPVHGMLLMGLFEQVIAAWRPDFHVRRLHATFLRPVLRGSSVAIGGKVVRAIREGDRVMLDLRLLVRTEGGALACAGEASGQIADDPGGD